MTDAEFEAIRAKVDELFQLWQQRLGLQQWSLIIDYYRNGLDDPGDDADPNTTMDIEPDWRYLKAHIRVNCLNLHRSEAGDDDIARAVVHELCHMHVNELRAEVPDENRERHFDHEERVVSTLTGIFCELYARIEA